MVKRSVGKMSKRSRLLGKTKQRLTVNRLLKSFSLGERVVIDLKARFSGMPHPRYRGRSGIVVGKRGSAYIVEIGEGKSLIVSPVHLEKG